MGTIRFDYQDLCLISVPTSVEGFENFVSTGRKNISRYYDVMADKGEIREVAILSKDRTKFVLLREYDEKVVRLVADFVEPSFFKDIYGNPEIHIQAVDTKFMWPRKDGFLHKLEITADEKRYGIEKSVLEDKNRRFVKGQFQNFLRDKVLDIENENRRELLEKSREEYQAIFE